MLRVFSKIRRGLFVEGKLLRYLSYAVGEIVLVVIGILIALQVNNWNEARKDRERELTILKEIHADLHIDLEEFDRNINHLNNQQVACRRMLEIVRENQPFDESCSFYLFYIQRYPRFTPKTGGYQLLQNKGLELIGDDGLRRAITDLYEYGYPYIKANEDDLELFNSSLFAPALNKYFGSELLSDVNVPADLELPTSMTEQPLVNMRAFEAFKKDEDLHAMIRSSEINAGSYLFSHHYSLREIRTLIAKLEAEIDGSN